MIQIEIGQTIIIRNKQLVCLDISNYSLPCYYACEIAGSCNLFACRPSERNDGKQVYYKSLPREIKLISNLVEIPIGGTFIIKGVRYRAELAEKREGHIFKCGQCAFYSEPLIKTCFDLQCVSLFRHDAQEVIFVKDGEEISNNQYKEEI